MATNPSGSDPKFTQEVLTANAKVTAAKTTLEDTTGAVKLLTFGDYGGQIISLKATPLATVTATRLLVHRVRPSVSTTVAHLAGSKTMSAQTLSNTQETTPTTFSYDATTPLRGGPGEEIWVGASVALAGGIVFDAEYENF